MARSKSEAQESASEARRALDRAVAAFDNVKHLAAAQILHAAKDAVAIAEKALAAAQNELDAFSAAEQEAVDSAPNELDAFSAA